MGETILFHADQRSFSVPLIPRPETDSGKPKNFGLFLPDRYRGCWPTEPQLVMLRRDLGITSVLTLYSTIDPYETEALGSLGVFLAKEGLRHDAVDIDTANSFLEAAQLLLSTQKPSYLHCGSGANRTGITVLVASLLQEKKEKKIIDESRISKLLSEAISYGFDFDNPRRKKDMEDVLAMLLIKRII